MVQAIKSFADGLRKGLGILVRCQCGKQAIFRASDFMDVIAPGEDIEARVWRCTWCRKRASFVRYVPLDGVEREDLSRWSPRPS